MISSLLIALALISVNALHSDHGDGHKCTHDHLNHPEPEFLDIAENFNKANGKGRNLQSYSNIRMYGYYENLNSAPSDYKSYFETQLGPAVLDYFQGALKVKYPVEGLLQVPSNKDTLCSLPTPDILKTGVEADYVIMFDSTSDSGSWVAESYSCYQASGSKRPLVAKSLLNRNLFKNPGSNILLHEKNIYLVLHEMTHTLGFSTFLYKYFLDANGEVMTGHVLKKSTSKGTATVIDVPPLTDRVRKFFGCPSVAGMYMENTGSDATAGSHFERRMYPFEAMTSGLTYQQSYSEFSLALLESTGWYIPDYSYADAYWFGQGQGCGFLTDSSSVANSKYSDFCDASTRGCTVPGRSGGRCGDDTRGDGCKWIRADEDYDCDNPDAASNSQLPELQAYGRDAYSKCFTGTLSSSKSSKTNSFCFKYKCIGSGSTTQLEVTLGGNAVMCTSKGPISITGYNGEIDCPDPLTFCSTVGQKTCPRGCMGRGSCVDGKCQCRSGYHGKDCAAQV